MRATLVAAARSTAKASTTKVHASKVSAARTSTPVQAAIKKTKVSTPSAELTEARSGGSKAVSSATSKLATQHAAPIKAGTQEKQTVTSTSTLPVPENTTAVKSILNATFRSGKGIKVAKYNEVASPQLCDDAISYLKPILDKYKGCILVDVNPGACIWSTKLHEYLKPRCHYLVEGDRKMIEHFVKPRLAMPESRYVHIKRTVNPINFLDVMTEELVNTGRLAPSDAPWEPGDAREREINHDVLFIGQLWRWQVSVGGITDQRAKIGRLIAHAFTKAAVSNTSMHKYGLVRGIFWMREDEKAHIIPVNDLLKRARLVRLNLFAKINEVVGVKPLHLSHGGTRTITTREPYLEIIRAQQVEARSRELGMILPTHRSLCLATPAQEAPDGIRIQSPFESLLTDRAAIEAYTADCEATFGMTSELGGGDFRYRRRSLRDEMKALADHIEFDFLHHIKTLWTPLRRQAVGGTIRTAFDVNNFLRTLRLEASVFAFEQTHQTTLTDIRDRIKALEELQQETVNGKGMNYPRMMSAICDELHSAFTDPPVLTRDRRDFESMQADAKDFFPSSSPLTLLEFTPAASDASVPGVASRADGSAALFELCKQLLPLSSHQLCSALNNIAANAGRDLTAMVPELQDPRRGGRLHPEHMRVRMLSNEMMEKLNNAFWEWPFRPALWELESRGADFASFLADGHP